MVELNCIYNENCFNTMSRMENNSVDIVLTSPPYNMTKRKGGYADTGRYDVYQDWLTEDEYIANTVRLFNEFNSIIVKNGIVLYNFSYSIENPTLPYKIVSYISENTEWDLVDTIIWKKKSGLPFPANQRRLSRIWEFVWVFARKSEINTFNCNKKIKSISEKTGQKYYEVYYNIINADNNDGATPKLNQATYSTDLCSQLFQIYGKEGYVVYDPYMGTGTTGCACIINKMSYVGSEISEDQCKYAEERIKKVEKKWLI